MGILKVVGENFLQEVHNQNLVGVMDLSGEEKVTIKKKDYELVKNFFMQYPQYLTLLEDET